MADAPKCGAKRRGKAACQLPAGWGTDHVGFGRCKLHGGRTVTHRLRAAGEEARAEAIKAVVMGAATPTTPEAALQLCIDITQGEVDYCSDRITRLTEAEATIVATSERLHEELDRQGDVHELRDHTTESTAQLHIWITTRQGAVDRLARYSKMALDAGVAERLARLDEGKAELIVAVMLAVVRQLPSLSATDRDRMPALLAEHIGRFDEPAIEGAVEQ